MEDIKQYIEMMIESLRKKSRILDRIQQANQRLEQLAMQPDMELEDLREILDEKDSCVDEINQMDQGFQTVFDKLKAELQDNKQQYREQILTMQQLIREITDKVVAVREQEVKNKLVMEGQFARQYKNIRAAQKGVNVAQNYYKSMSGMNIVDSQFMDRKK